MSDNSFNGNDFYSNPNNLIFYKNLTEDSLCSILLDNMFIIFKSFNDIYYLIYSNKQQSIISFNLLNYQKINEVKNAHGENIINFRHYLDKINNIDFIISISDNKIKLWKITNFECILNLTNIYNYGRIEIVVFYILKRKIILLPLIVIMIQFLNL